MSEKTYVSVGQVELGVVAHQDLDVRGLVVVALEELLGVVQHLGESVHHDEVRLSDQKPGGGLEWGWWWCWC